MRMNSQTLLHQVQVVDQEGPYLWYYNRRQNCILQCKPSSKEILQIVHGIDVRLYRYRFAAKYEGKNGFPNHSIETYFQSSSHEPLAPQLKYHYILICKIAATRICDRNVLYKSMPMYFIVTAARDSTTWCKMNLYFQKHCSWEVCNTCNLVVTQLRFT